MNRENHASGESLVCTLPSAELRNRRIKIQELIDGAQSVVPTSAGLRFVFHNTNETAHALIDFILFEQKCCGGVTYELQSAPPHTDLVLKLYATGDLLSSLQALYLGAGVPVLARDER